MQTSISARMVALKAQVSLRSKPPKTLVMPSHNSTAMTGKVGHWRFVRTDSLEPQVAVGLAVAVGLEAACVGGSVLEAVLVAVAALVAAMVDVEATEVVMEDPLEAASTTQLLLLLALLHQIPSLTSLPLEESQAS